jgi:flagellin
VHSMLQRVRDLKVQYDGGTLSSDDKVAVASEVAQIAQEIQDIVDPATGTQFNTRPLFTATGFTFQVGANNGDQITTTSADFSGGITVGGGLSDITTIATANAASVALNSGGSLASVATIDDAIKNVSKVRADFGAVQNRLEHRLNNLATYQENLTASESRIRDVDMAAEMTKFTKLNILQQAGTSMLAQANQAPQGVLTLLR